MTSLQPKKDGVLSLPLKRIRRAGRKVGLGADGNTEQLRQRPQRDFHRKDESSTTKSIQPGIETSGAITAKRAKKAIEDDLICSITRELPFDPVTAEDGRYVCAIRIRSSDHIFFSAG